MSSVIKGNRPLRMFSAMVLIVLVVSHFMEQVDLTELSFLWLLIAMSLNAFQASFSGFCPMFKNAKGECVACGVACDSPSQNETVKSKTSCCSTEDSSCCSGQDSKAKASCCSSSDSDCCTDTKTKEPCCSDSESEKSGCCDQSTGCCEPNESSEMVVKVLGTGCKNCDDTAQLIEQVASESKVKVKLVKIQDVAEIASYGVMSTPAVVIGDEVVHSGSVPSKQAVLSWLVK